MKNKYYHKHKENIQKEAHERYQYLSEEKKKQKLKKGLRKISKF